MIQQQVLTREEPAGGSGTWAVLPAQPGEQASPQSLACQLTKQKGSLDFVSERKQPWEKQTAHQTPSFTSCRLHAS